MSLSFKIFIVVSLMVGAYMAEPTALTDSSFNKFLKDHEKDVVFVDFYSPRCGHCQDLEPTWNSLAEVFEKEEVSVDGLKYHIAKVNVPENRELAKKFEIRAYPTLLLFRNGRTYQYKGPRTVEKFVQFLRYDYETFPSTHFVLGEPSYLDYFIGLKDNVVAAAKLIPSLWTNYQKGAIVVLIFASLIGIMFTLITCFIPPTNVLVDRKKKD